MIPHSRPDLKKEDFHYIRQILKSRQVAAGPWVQRLEGHFCRVAGNRYAVSTASGTAALHLGLLALGIRPNDEVLVPSYTCSAVAQAVRQTGAVPRFVDIDLKTLNVSRATAAIQCTRKTRAVIVTHTLGFPAPTREILSLGLPVIEDCAAALGCSTAGKPVGSLGGCSTFSFYATKVICAGEGGMITTNGTEIFGRLKAMSRSDGCRDALSDLAAGLALSQVKRLPALLKRRRIIAKRYREAFSDCRVAIQEAIPGSRTNHYRFLLRSPRASKLIRTARRYGVLCDRPIGEPLHRRFSDASPRQFANTEAAYSEVVSVPIYPSLTDREVARVIDVLRRILKGRESR